MMPIVEKFKTTEANTRGLESSVVHPWAVTQGGIPAVISLLYFMAHGQKALLLFPNSESQREGRWDKQCSKEGMA